MHTVLRRSNGWSKRWLLAPACALLGCVAATRGLDTAPAANPMTVKEICTELRGGAASNDVLTDLAARRLLEAPKPAEEADLKAAGASPHLVDSLKSGTYTLTPFEANDVRRRQTLPAGAPGAAPTFGHIASLLRGKLVTMQNGALRPYDDNKLAGKKYYGIYFSAHWCPPCRLFTPKLVQFYQQTAAQHPEFEIVFVSSDEGPAEMQQYMREERMPWAALRYERKANERELTHYEGRGIPDLVLVDGDGKVLADSYAGKQYLGPYQVVRELERRLNVPPMNMN